MKPHNPPDQVTSPLAHWNLIDVLDNHGPGDIAVALGKWDQNPVLAMRWNGDDSGSPVGSPQSRGLSTWFILPEGVYTEAIINTLPPEKKTLVRNFIPEFSPGA